jgi:signal transduction histidine kinase
MRSSDTNDRYTILVVDDDPDALTLAETQLARLGHRVLLAHSSDEALSLFLANEVHLLLVDYVMPGMDGPQLVRAIRGFDPFIQIVIQTAHAAQRPSQQVLDELDIQGFHDKSDGVQRLAAWVTVCLRACRLIRRLRERERSQHELLSNLSHEFRTPLNIAHGYVQLLLDDAFGAVPAAAQDALRALEQNVRELADVIDNVLDHSRLAAGAAELSLGGVDVTPLLAELGRLAGPLLRDKPVAFTVHAEPELPVIESDAQKLRTILRNLLSNAVKFTREGAIDVRVRHTGDAVVIAVSDSGIGIAATQLESLFDPYRQGDGSSTREHGGLGIGLALSRQYARLLGGNLTVESTLGVGSTFTLTIPAVPGILTLDTLVAPPAPPHRPERAAAVNGSTEPPALPWSAGVVGWAMDVLGRFLPAPPFGS